MKPRLTWESQRVTEVELPPAPPANWTPEHLRALDAELAALPLGYPPGASAFRRRVWDALRQIPFGHTVTYRELARRIGHPKAARAVGGACAANPLLLAVPCHRVVAQHGLGGFALGLDWKRRLLELEAAAVTAAPATGSASKGRSKAGRSQSGNRS